MSGLRIAVVSTDGKNVDDHFGKAVRFLIYDLNDKVAFVEDRPTEKYSVGDPDHDFDPVKFDKVTGVIKDCAKIYITRIGEVPEAELKKIGIEPVIYSGPINNIPRSSP